MSREMSCAKILRQLECVFGAAKIGVDIIDSKYNIRYIDPAWEKKYGDTAGKKCYQYFMGRKKVCPGCSIRKALQSKKIIVADEILTAEKNRPIRVTTVPFRDDEGEWLVAETNVDIAEIKKVEEQLRETAGWYKQLFDKSNDAIFIADLSSRMLVDCNKKALEMTGYSRRQILSMKADRLHPKELVASTVARFRETSLGKIVATETEILTKDGKKIPVSIIGTILDIKGRQQLMGIFRDVSCQREAQSRAAIFQKFADNAGQGFSMADLKGDITYANRSLCRIFDEKSPEDVCGKNIRHYYPVSYHRQLKEEVLPAVIRKWEWTGESVLVSLKGRMIPVIENIFLIRDSAGKPQFYANVVTDITDRKKAEKDTQRAGSLLTATIESAFAGILVVDCKGRITSFNKKFVEMWRIPKTVIDLHDDRKALDFVVAQLKDPKGFLRKVKELYAHPERESYDLIEFNDGRFFERYSRPQRIGRQITGRVWSFHDITGLKMTDIALRQSEERYRLLAESAQDAIFIVDRDYRYVYMNTYCAKTLGRERKSLVGRRIKETFPSDAAKVTVRNNMRVFKSGKPLFIIEKLRFSGGWRWLDTRLSPIKNQAGKVIYVMGIARDITMQKDADEVLRRDKQGLEKIVAERSAKLLEAQGSLHKAKRLSDIGLLAATVAHELRSPLAAIRTAAYNIKTKSADPLLKSHLENIDKKVIESDQIIKNLLFYSSIKPPHFEPVDLCVILEECVALSREVFKGFAVDIRIAIKSRKECMLEADPFQIKEVFHNILNNAYEAFDDSKGAIDIEVRLMKGGYLTVSFADDGPGIKAADLKEIPRPFFTTKVRGIGLGLPVCYQIVELHGGQIWIKSRLGKGTTITIALPVKTMSVGSKKKWKKVNK